MDRAHLKRRAFSGAVWKFAEQFGAQIISLIVSTVLARILSPDDYSVVGIVTIFFAFSNVFVTGGFNTALIRKKDADIRDYSSVLLISLLVAFVLYAILFFASPVIARWYAKPLLVPVFRVMGVMLLVDAVKAVLCAYVANNLLFRKFFFSTLGALIVSAVVGIIMALKGFGPWALVTQNIVNGVAGTTILFLTIKFRPKPMISWERIKELFGFGWKIFVASIITIIYDEINPLIIGLKYSATDLSYYTKGKSYPAMLQSSVNGTLSSVLFPVMSKVQDDKTALVNCTRRFFKTTSFLVFPLMIGFMAVSDSFIKILLTEKWMSASVYIKIFCFSYMFNMIQTGNLQTIRAMGRSDIILKLEIIKKSIYTAITAVAVFCAKKPEILAMTVLLNTMIAMLINSWPNKKLIGYSFGQQLWDILPNLMVAAVMGIIVAAIGSLAEVSVWMLAVQIISGAVVYVGINLIIRNPDMQYVLNVLKDFKNKRKKDGTA